MKEYYYICNKCVDSQEVECYTVGIIGEQICYICKENTNPENLSCISKQGTLKVLLKALCSQFCYPMPISEIFTIKRVIDGEPLDGISLDDIELSNQ